MNDTVQIFIENIIDIIDENDWYKVFKSAYESRFLQDDFIDFIQILKESDIYTDDIENGRRRAFLDIFYAKLCYVKHFPRFLYSILDKDLGNRIFGYDMVDAENIIIDSIKNNITSNFTVFKSKNNYWVIDEVSDD